MKPNWEDAPDQAKILAQQENGRWVFGSFEDAEPSTIGGWRGIGDGQWFFFDADEKNPNWKKTFERRPFGIETPEKRMGLEQDRNSDKHDNALIRHGEPTIEEEEAWNALEEKQIGEMLSKYHVKIKGIQIDVYDVLHAFGVTNPADAHAIKKLLKAGQRGYKDASQDRQEAIDSIKRAMELEDD